MKNESTSVRTMTIALWHLYMYIVEYYDSSSRCIHFTFLTIEDSKEIVSRWKEEESMKGTYVEG